MNDRRLHKLEKVARMSQLSITVILENVDDTHNVGAIMRSCDSIGIRKMYVVNTKEGNANDNLIVGKRTSMGTRKWVDVSFFKTLKSCIESVRKEFPYIVGAAISDSSGSYFNTDFTKPIAIMLGNEHDGLSPEAISSCDALINIPQVGMAESLNVSAAAAIILYEAYRQRFNVGKYSIEPDITAVQAHDLLELFIEKTKIQTRNIKRYKLNPLDK